MGVKIEKKIVLIKLIKTIKIYKWEEAAAGLEIAPGGNVKYN